MSMRALAVNPATDRWPCGLASTRAPRAHRVVDYLTDDVVAHVH